MALRRGILAVAAVLGLVAGCGSGGDSSNTAPSSGPSSGPLSGSSSASPSAGGVGAPSLDGSFDVGGHKLAMKCWETGSPTVVYLHGFINDPGGGGASNAGEIPQLLAPQVRVCAYDRANVGASGKSAGRQTAMHSVRDLHALLKAAAVPPPYVMLGASFGGLIATLYAANHPADVAGMVLLDGSLADDFAVERKIVPAADVEPVPGWQANQEKIDLPASYREAMALLRTRKPPAVPVTYLAVRDLELPPAYPAEKLAAAIRQQQQAFVRQFKPGQLKYVDAPHYMEPEIPDQIATEVRTVIATTP